jgi:Acyl-CoA reductase (LuxC)
VTAIDARHVPRGLETAFASRELRFNSVAVEVAVPVDGAAILASLRERRHDMLGRLPVRRIVAAIATAAADLREHAEARAEVEALVGATGGLTPPMVAALLDAMLGALTEARLEEFLAAELGDARALDELRPRRSAGGLARAHGPDVVVAVLGGGDPFLPALEFARVLLVKSALVARVSAGAPIFASMFARRLAAADPVVGDAIAVCWWPHRPAPRAAAELLGGADRVIVSGSAETLAAIGGGVPAERIVAQPARIGLALVGHQHGSETASETARAVALADQRSCLSPQAVFVEGTAAAAHRFAEDVAAELERIERELPRGAVSTSEQAALEGEFSLARFRQAAGNSGVEVLAPQRPLRWLVVVGAADELRPGPAGRCVRVWPVARLEDALPFIRAAQPLVAAVGVAALPGRAAALAEPLGQAGVSRVCALDRLLAPPLTWHDDGRGRLAPLVRWSDYEP